MSSYTAQSTGERHLTRPNRSIELAQVGAGQLAYAHSASCRLDEERSGCSLSLDRSLSTLT